MEKEDIVKLRKLKEEMDEVSDELRKEASRIRGDVITIRNDPRVKKIWNKLCRLHMKAMVTCEYGEYGVGQTGEFAKLCEDLLRPRACIEALHLSEEETCCGRFLERIREEKG